RSPLFPYTDALPISILRGMRRRAGADLFLVPALESAGSSLLRRVRRRAARGGPGPRAPAPRASDTYRDTPQGLADKIRQSRFALDRKSTRLNSSHVA